MIKTNIDAILKALDAILTDEQFFDLEDKVIEFTHSMRSVEGKPYFEFDPEDVKNIGLSRDDAKKFLSLIDNNEDRFKSDPFELFLIYYD
ncbi:MAG: hypothetical protein ACK5MW_09630 [Enterococcus sp.]